MWLAKILLLSTNTWAKAPPKDPEIVTNFLTEADLSRWFVRIMWALALSLGPILLTQFFSIWNERKNSPKTELHELKEMFKEEMKNLKTEMSDIRKSMVSASDVHKIARDEIEFTERVKRRQ